MPGPVEVKRCTKCKVLQPIEAFSRKSGERRSSICKTCVRAYSRRHYLKYRQRYLERNSQRKAALMSWIRELKETTPCADCNRNFLIMSWTLIILTAGTRRRQSLI